MRVVAELPTAAELKSFLPISMELAACKAQRDAELASVLRGDSDKFLVVVGPCSADDPAAVVEYAAELAQIAKDAPQIHVIMRVFTAKPRTTTTGYMGLIHDMGVEAARRLHLDVLAASGGVLSTADELLYPALYPYFSDIVSYFTIGARSSENQEHRLVASGINAAVAVKNPLSGDVSAMVNAVFAIKQPQDFIFCGNLVNSGGNLLAHGILRGCDMPNYHITNLLEIDDMFSKIGINSPALIIDTNHGNSGKNHAKQPEIAHNVMQMRQNHPKIRRLVRGLMIESYIKEGCQNSHGAAYGRSVTDPCLSLADTADLIYTISSQI